MNVSYRGPKQRRPSRAALAAIAVQRAEARRQEEEFYRLQPGRRASVAVMPISYTYAQCRDLPSGLVRNFDSRTWTHI